MCAVEFHTVKTRLHCSGSRFSETFCHFCDLLFCHSRKCDPRSHRHIACHKNLCSAIHSHRQASLPELKSRFPACFMDRVRQLFQPRNILILADGEKTAGCAGRVYTADFHHIQTTAAFYSRHMITDQARRNIAVFSGEFRAHGRKNDPVLKLHVFHRNRTEQFFKHLTASLAFFFYSTPSTEGTVKCKNCTILQYFRRYYAIIIVHY